MKKNMYFEVTKENTIFIIKIIKRFLLFLHVVRVLICALNFCPDLHYTIIFFITSHDGYITDIFRLGTFQFLMKPINEEDFKLDFLRAIQHYTHNHTKLELKQKDRIICIENIEILYIAVHHKKITVYTRKGNYEFVGRIAEYENKLKAYSFVNCHKSIIVNLEHIEEIKFDSVKLLDCDSYIPISRNYHESFLKKFNQFSEGKYL